jgi:folate-dependent phosphoribosylglycinamide formyltransferase PurN
VNTLKLGVLGSTKGTDLQAILDAISSGELDAEISIELSNRKKAYILERAENHNVPALFMSQKDKTREEFDSEMTTILIKHKVDLVLLIGFMRILSAKFCRERGEKLLKVHPSLLPK